jgi:hypothetical protein
MASRARVGDAGLVAHGFGVDGLPRSLKSASSAMRVVESTRSGLPVLPETASAIERKQASIHFRSSASIAVPNSIMGSTASHMRVKCPSNFAAAPASPMAIRSMSCAFSPLVVKFAEQLGLLQTSLAATNRFYSSFG